MELGGKGVELTLKEEPDGEGIGDRGYESLGFDKS